jgi:hypothetical protein
MTWLEHHSESEKLAAAAEAAAKEGQLERAQGLYRSAAEAEVLAIGNLDTTKPRTVGITIVSAVALWRKAHEYERALRLALSLLFNPSRCLEELRPFVKRLGHGSEQHPAWTNVFRVECQTQGARRPR